MKPGRSCCSWHSFTLIYIEYMSMPVLSVSCRTTNYSRAVACVVTQNLIRFCGPRTTRASRPTSPDCSGRRWIWCGGWRGGMPTGPKRAKQYRSRPTRKRSSWCVNGSGSTSRACLAIGGRLSRKSAPRCGMRPWIGPGSRRFDGTICGTPGRAGTYSKGRQCLCCRNSAVGKSAEVVRRYAHLAAEHLASLCRTPLRFALRELRR
jgi:hypothetical protein